MTLYLGENLISGVATPVEPTRNIGQIITSTIPLTDAGLHLLDGALIDGSGIYSASVDYIADLYNTSADKYSNVTKVGSLTDNNGVLSGFSTSNYARTSIFQPMNNPWEVCVKFILNSVGSSQSLYGGGGVNQRLILGVLSTGAPYVDLAHTDGSFDIGRLSLDVVLNANQEYWLKCEFTGSQYILSLSEDGVNYNITNNLQSTLAIYNVAFPLSIGANQYSSGVNIPLNGTIDLKESYINVNGSRWWTGVNPSWAVDETQWQASVTQYGVCGKFVYDNVNNTVRLPKITGITEGTTDLTALGDLIQAGLPNITGTFNIGGTNASTATGAFYKTSTGIAGEGGGAGTDMTGHFDASLSNPIYGNSNTVQPQAINVLYYIVLATSTKTEIEIDIDQVTTDLNGKADVDLSNATPAISFANAMNTAGIITIVETYINGASWYRVYSDGWCEQGSYIGVVGNQDATVTLLKPYRDTNYARQASLNNLGNVSDNININNITNSSFTLYGTTISPAGGWTAGATWQAAGYII